MLKHRRTPMLLQQKQSVFDKPMPNSCCNDSKKMPRGRRRQRHISTSNSCFCSNSSRKISSFSNSSNCSNRWHNSRGCYFSSKLSSNSSAYSSSNSRRSSRELKLMLRPWLPRPHTRPKLLSS